MGTGGNELGTAGVNQAPIEVEAALTTIATANILVKASHQLTRGRTLVHPAAQVSISKEATTVVGDGRTQEAVNKRVKQIRNLAAETEQEYEKEKLNERIARLSGGVAIIQVRCLRRSVVETHCVAGSL